MCGRARCSLSREEVRAEASIARWRDEEAYEPSFNASPGRSTPVLKQPGPDDERELHTMKWGLVPSYTRTGEKPDYFRMFNARSETVGEKGVFKKLLSRQRCVVFMNGFYEWKKEGIQKQPYFVFREGHTALRMAGLFDIWKGTGEQPMFSFTILTTDSSEKLQWLHDRMPVILPDEAAVDLWLSGGSEEAVQQLSTLCQPYNGEDLQWFAVDPLMNNMKRDGPECCKPLKRKSIATFFKPKQEATAAPDEKVKPEPKGSGDKASVKKDEHKQTAVKKEDPDAKVDIRNTDEASVKPEVKPEQGVEDRTRADSILESDALQDEAREVAREAVADATETASSGLEQNGSQDSKHGKGQVMTSKGQTDSAKTSEQKRPHTGASPPSARKKQKTGSSTPQQNKITSFFGQKTSK